ncbi:MAG TPA: hypothetical protein VHM90_05285 [Phycisphaerae bacterium]|nr:hypothetical protein [Phycisphaerae bacterium]
MLSRRAGIVLFAWSPFLFLLGLVAGLGAAVLIAEACAQLALALEGRTEWPVALAILPLSLVPGLTTVALFRIGLGTVRLAADMMRGLPPPPKMTLQKINVVEAITYTLGAFLVASALGYPWMALVGAGLIVVGVALTLTRTMLRRARSQYLTVVNHVPAS